MTLTFYPPPPPPLNVTAFQARFKAVTKISYFDTLMNAGGMSSLVQPQESYCQQILYCCKTQGRRHDFGIGGGPS